MKTLTQYFWRALRWCGFWKGSIVEQLELPLVHRKRRRR
jgi:hypothetical protein